MALVHEAYLRLIGPEDVACWDNRGHFFAAAAEAMRRILIEAARRKRGPESGGQLVRRQLDPELPAVLDRKRDREGDLETKRSGSVRRLATTGSIRFFSPPQRCSSLSVARKEPDDSLTRALNSGISATSNKPLASDSQWWHETGAFDRFFAEADESGVANADEKLHVEDFGNGLLELQEADGLAGQRVEAPDTAFALSELFDHRDLAECFGFAGLRQADEGIASRERQAAWVAGKLSHDIGSPGMWIDGDEATAS